MSSALSLSVLTFTSASPADVQQGLLGWLSVRVDDSLVLDGIALRRTRNGQLTLSFPERRDSNGRRHPLIRPLDDGARRAIERQILEALGLAEVTP